MSNETKQDITDACAVAMLPVFITAVFVMDALLFPFFDNTLGGINALFAASIIAGLMTGVSYMLIAASMRFLTNHIRRFKH